MRVGPTILGKRRLSSHLPAESGKKPPKLVASVQYGDGTIDPGYQGRDLKDTPIPRGCSLRIHCVKASTFFEKPTVIGSRPRGRAAQIARAISFTDGLLLGGRDALSVL